METLIDTYSVAFYFGCTVVLSVLVDVVARFSAVDVRCCVMLVAGRARKGGVKNGFC